MTVDEVRATVRDIRQAPHRIALVAVVPCRSGWVAYVYDRTEQALWSFHTYATFKWHFRAPIRRWGSPPSRPLSKIIASGTPQPTMLSLTQLNDLLERLDDDVWELREILSTVQAPETIYYRVWLTNRTPVVVPRPPFTRRPAPERVGPVLVTAADVARELAPVPRPARTRARLNAR